MGWVVPLGLSLGLAALGSGDMNVGGGRGVSGTTVQCPDEETGLRGGQGTYQLVDAVNGPVVLVTEPLHAFEAEKGKGKALVTAKLRTGHWERMAHGQAAWGRAEPRSHQGRGQRPQGSTEHPTRARDWARSFRPRWSWR